MEGIGVPKLKRFLKQHVIWMVMLAVAVPLLVVLIVQYRSLVGLKKSLPTAEKAWIRSFLVAVASRVEEFYQASAEQFLTVPPGLFDQEMVEINETNVETHFERSAGKSGIAAYFDKHPAKGAKRAFIILAGWRKSGAPYYILYFYNPDTESRFERHPGTAEWRAAHAGSGHWMYQANATKILEPPAMTVSERDPENPVISKPILNKDSMVVGIIGLIVDEADLRNEVLPRAIESLLPQFFPDDPGDVIVGLHGGGANTSFIIQQVEVKDYEVSEPLRFVFKDRQLGALRRSGTLHQASGRVFATNLSLSILMVALVVAAVVLALRTASREMRLSKMKSDFVSNVSHELRTPLASIRVFGEFFRLGWVKDPVKMREYGEYIENESRRLTQLINNILDFSRIESGNKTYEFKRADVKEVVSEALKTFDVRLRQSGFNVIFDAPEGPLPRALINRDAITQSLMNLVDNAIKYSAGSRKILVRLAHEKGYVTISVTDYGIGIPREEQERAFEKFYRVSTGLVHDVKGSGLGLAIVKHIVEAHKGKITVDSEPGRGSTFTIFLPADQSPADDNVNEESFTLSGHDVSVGSGV